MCVETPVEDGGDVAGTLERALGGGLAQRGEGVDIVESEVGQVGVQRGPGGRVAHAGHDAFGLCSQFGHRVVTEDASGGVSEGVLVAWQRRRDQGARVMLVTQHRRRGDDGAVTRDDLLEGFDDGGWDEHLGRDDVVLVAVATVGDEDMVGVASSGRADVEQLPVFAPGQ